MRFSGEGADRPHRPDEGGQATVHDTPTGARATAAAAGVRAEALLAERIELQAIIDEISVRAATGPADEAALQRINADVRDALGVAGVAYQLREEGQFRIVATTDFQGKVVMKPGDITGPDAPIVELTRDRHLVRGFDAIDLDADPQSVTVGEVLVVAVHGPGGVVGAMTYADPDPHEWSPAFVDAAKALASVLHNLTMRTEAEQRDRARLALSNLVRDIAGDAATTTLDNLSDFVHRSLSAINEHFGIVGSSLWESADGGLVRRYGVWRDGRTSTLATRIPITAEQRQRLAELGHVFIRVGDLEVRDELFEADAVALVVAVGADLDGAIVMVDPDRRWTEEEITAARSLAGLAAQTKIRLDAEQHLRNRLRVEEFTARVSAMAVEVTPADLDSFFDDVMSETVSFFGLTEASLWRIDDSRMRCVAARRAGAPTDVVGLELERVGLEFDGSIRGLLETRGWTVAPMGGLAPPGLAPRDPADAKVLVTAARGPSGMLGVLAFIDTQRRWWDDEALGLARTVADIVGQVWSRVMVTDQLARQRGVDDILTEASARFVQVTRVDAEGVVVECFEALRRHLGLACVGLLELHHEPMELWGRCEATDGSPPFIAPLSPVPRDSQAVARMLDPAGPTQWRLGDLFPDADRPDARLLVNRAVSTRDIVLLLAVDAAGEELPPEVETAIRSMGALVAQLRRRLLMERTSARAMAADELLADIARLFIDQPGLDHEAAIEEALARVGDFFSPATVSRWDIEDDQAHRAMDWRDTAREREVADPLRVIDRSQPVASLVDWTGATVVTEFGDAALFEHQRHDTVVLRALLHDGEPRSVLALRIPRASADVPDVAVHRDTIEGVGRLIEQLWRRAEADLDVARRLRAEDLLRKFTTRLLNSPLATDEPIADAFLDLMAAVGVDYAVIWRTVPETGGPEVEVAFEVAAHGAKRLADVAPDFRCDANFDQAVPGLGDPLADVALDAAPTGVGEAVRLVVDPGLRRVAVIAEPDADSHASQGHLIITRPGTEPLREDELEMFRSALSILGQHEARVTAQRWFTAAFESAPVGISMRDSQLQLIECNAAYAAFLGRDRHDLIGTSLADILTPDLVAARQEELGRLSDGLIEHESSYRRLDGSVAWGSGRSTPVRVPGRRDPLILSYVEDITERRRSREMLEYQATHDELTGLPNRRALVAELAAELSRDRRCAVLVLDLDRFKVVNDSLGHSAGDQLLVTCADRIRLSLRPGDAVCRLGGDEFAILLRAPTDDHDACVVAERLLALLRDPVMVGEDEIYPSASLGIARPQDGDTVDDLLRHADAAMYQAKAQGRDRWEAFDGSMRQAVVERIRTETDLRRAIDNGQLEVHYQPEFLLESGVVAGVEALVRWRHPERGLLAAGSFISLAEETGLVVDLGRWVLGQATAQAARWRSEGHDIVTRVNLSARQLRSAVVEEVQDALAAADLEPERLCLELTETAIMDDVQESARILGKFRELGVQVAIDDFGTGFSSLAYLKRFPVDILKIDRTFVDGVGVDPDDTAIVSSIVGLARTLRLEVVAEGIEDESQVHELVRLGCDRGQGFHLARPAPASDVSRLLGEPRSTR